MAHGLCNFATHFNPRPREEGDGNTSQKRSGAFSISIHALVKRATTKSLGGLPQKWISIHALVKRATLTAGCVYGKL